MQKATHWSFEPSEFSSLAKNFVEEILPGIRGTPQERYLAVGECWKLDGANLWIVREGDLEIRMKSKAICCLRAGEMVGPWFGCNGDLGCFGINDGCHVVGYKYEDLSNYFGHVPAALVKWSGLVSAAAGYYFQQFASLKAQGAPPAPKFRQFAAGETILKEGEFSQEVLCLVDGGADVVAHGAIVGKVKEEELFGALAAITGAPRMASVVATKPSVCMVFERDDFEDLLRSHTALMSKLFEDLARAMHAANARIAELEGAKKNEIRGSRWI